MEPQISANLRASTRLGLTPCLLADLGWKIRRRGSCFGRTPDFAEMMVSTTELNLGNEIPGQTISAEILVTNPSTLAFEVDTAGSGNALADPFAIGSENCSGSTLPPGGACTILVTFSPTQPGSFEDNFSISYDEPAGEEISIRVTGRGIADTRPVSASFQSPAMVNSGGGALSPVVWLLMYLGSLPIASAIRVSAGRCSRCSRRFYPWE